MQPKRVSVLLLTLAALAGSVGPTVAWPGPLLLAGQGGGAASAAQAAEQAKRRTGGRVLSVREQGSGWEVKVLTPSGEVRSVFVPGRGR